MTKNRRLTGTKYKQLCNYYTIIIRNYKGGRGKEYSVDQTNGNEGK